MTFNRFDNQSENNKRPNANKLTGIKNNLKLINKRLSLLPTTKKKLHKNHYFTKVRITNNAIWSYWL